MAPLPVTIGDYTLVAEPIIEFGYLTVAVDMGQAGGALTISFHARSDAAVRDSVTIDLATSQIVGAAPAAKLGKRCRPRPRRRCRPNGLVA